MVDSCILKMPQYCKCCEYGLIYLLRSRSQTIQQASQRNYLYPSTQVSNARCSTDLWWPQLLNASMSSQNYTCSLLTCFILKVQSVIFDFFFPEKKDTVLINIDAVMSKYTFQQTNAFWKLIILKSEFAVCGGGHWAIFLSQSSPASDICSMPKEEEKLFASFKLVPALSDSRYERSYTV